MTKFKVGDWVRNVYTELPYRFSDTDLKFVEVDPTYANDKLWEPKVGDWCWFWNNKGKVLIGTFWSQDENIYFYNSPFINTDHNIIGTERYKSQHCEPFIGTLPSFLSI
jgi:hypothetical protein